MSKKTEEKNKSRTVKIMKVAKKVGKTILRANPMLRPAPKKT